MTSPAPTRRTSATTQAEARHASWEREMKRLSVITRLLASVWLALGVRMLITGPALTSGLLAGVIAGLLLAAIWLTRRGHRVEPSLPAVVANAVPAGPRKRGMPGHTERS